VDAPLERNSPAQSSDSEHVAREVLQRNANSIRSALKSAAIRDTEAVAVVPKQWVTLRIVTLPSADPGELPEMARFEAERHIPFNVERHIISYHILRADEIAGSQVLIAAIDGPPAGEITQTLSLAGLRAVALEVSTTALANALLYSGAWDSTADPTVAQINMGHSAADITILRNGLPIFARSVSLGIDKLAVPATGSPVILSEADLAGIDLLQSPARSIGSRPAGQFNVEAPGREIPVAPAPLDQADALEMWKNRLIQEIRRTHDFAAREFQCEPFSRLYISGVGCALGNIEAFLEGRLGVRPVVLDPFVKDLRHEPSAALAGKSACAIAAGAIVGHDDAKALRVNLLPNEYLRRESGAKRRQSLIITASLALAFLVCGFLYAHQLIQSKERELKEIKQELDRNLGRVADIKYKEGVVRFIGAHSDPKGSALGILNDMSDWPELFGSGGMRVSITEFEYSGGIKLKLSGHAFTHKDLNDFILKLEQSKHFVSVRKESTPLDNRTFPGNQRLILYTINCYFK
jgi:type IV pilus assembly protein PilM